MEKININFASKTIDIAEHDNYILLTNRVCYLDEPNGNGVCLPYDDPDATAEMTKTLIDMPVVAKYVCDEDGEPNLGGHEAYIDDEGEIAFATTPIGVHTDAYIKEDTVTTFAGETKTLPCVFATQKIWKRNKNMVAAVIRLFSEGNLHNSWELASTEYSFRDGIKYLTKYSYLGNCFLGDIVSPAYGKSAKVLSLSQEDNNAMLMVAEALAQDIAAGGKENEEQMDNENIITEVVDIDESVVEVVVDENLVAEEETPVVEEFEVVEVSELTYEDITKRIYKKLREKYEWGWITYIYPEEHYVLWHSYEMDELSYIKHNYIINGDEVEVDDGEEVKLVVSFAEINSKVAELNEALVSANSAIEEMKTEIASLSSYRDAYEQAEAERVAREHEAAVAEMRQYCVDSGRFTSEEIESEEVSALIESLDKTAINAMIAERLISEMRKQPVEIDTASHNGIKIALGAEINTSEVGEKVSAFRHFLSY